MGTAIGIMSFVLFLLRFPLWMVFLGVAFLGLGLLGSVPLQSVAARLFGGLNVFALLAVPGFIFAGELMMRGGMSRRLVEWVAALLGRVPGGVPLTAIGASEVFGAVSGSSTAAVAAVGKVLYPVLRQSGYSEPFSLGLVTSMGAVAGIIPPSITMILYAVVAQASVGKLFLAGVVPGLIIGALIFVYSVWYALRTGATANAQRRTDVWKATRDVLWTLGAPILIFGGIYSGLFTPTEASMVVSVYALLVGLFIYKELTPKAVWEATKESAYLTAKIFIIVAAAAVFSLLLVIQNVPGTLINAVNALNLGPVSILLLINAVLFMAGMFMDPNSAIIVLTPLLGPLARQIGVDPIHFGIIMTVNLAIGMFTPPFGLNLFVSTSIFNVPMTRVIHGVIPFMVVYLIGLGIVTYVPQLSLWLPALVD